MHTLYMGRHENTILAFMADIISMITMRPVTFFILLTIGVLLLPSIVIPYWYHMMIKIERNVEMEANYYHLQLISRIEDTAELIFASNSSATHLTSILAPQILHDKQLPFSEIQIKVAQALFEARRIIPHVTQASYIGLDGLLFSYFVDSDQTYAIYSNSSFPSNYSSTPGGYTWYTQLANSESGALHGEANITKPSPIVNETWFQRAMDSQNGYASLGYKWTSDKEAQEPDLFLDTARLDGAGAISLGFAVKELRNVFSSVNLNGGSLFIAAQFGNHDYKVLLQGIKEANIIVKGDKALIQGGNNNSIVREVSCKSKKGARNSDAGTILDIGVANLISYCSSIHIAGVPTIFVLAFPSKGLVSNVHKQTKVALMLLILMMVTMVISIFAFVALIVRAARREVHLCAAYMREMEKTAQAERKSMKQSLAFASANHDVRGYLACIKGLIELSHNDVHLSSELASNLKKIDDCAEDLLALVNSILDFSKIEAGKMQLEEAEFNLTQLVEDIADLYHPIAMKKGVEVILDPCDGSVIKFSHVKGDRAKLKQILTNLLSNAVKFTSEGHISIRVWAKQPSLEDSIIASNKNSLLNRLSSFFSKNKRAYNDLEELRTIKQDPNCMEFEFEVEDTGPGIPKDRRESIFENFVQVKENSTGQAGTGLGLGIVQSLVRLMGGDIKIVDGLNGEKGTCFKFNIFLITQENAPVNNVWQEGLESQAMRLGAGLSTCTRSPRVDGSLVVLLIKNDERRRMVQRYMEGLGIKLVVLRHVNQMPRALKRKIKPKLSVSRCYSSSSSGSLSGAYLSSCSDPCRGGSKLLPLSAMDGDDDLLPVYKRASFRGSLKCLMLVVDANAGDFQELCRFVAEFRRDLYLTCAKVVWLERPDTRGAHFPGLQNESLSPTDRIISKPLHGSRLFQIIGLLPEFGGDLMRMPPLRMTSGRVSPSNPQSETDQLGSSSSSEQLSSSRNVSSDFIIHNDMVKKEAYLDPERASSEKSSRRNQDVSGQGRPLSGMKFLIAEDTDMLRKLTATLINRWGAYADVCENGGEAVEIICKALSKLTVGGASEFPYDCILMDCQMPIMNGFEATKRIREEEKKYNIHIPVIALTAHEAGEEGKEIVEAGMDFHLSKPLKREELLEVLRLIDSRSS